MRARQFKILLLLGVVLACFFLLSPCALAEDEPEIRDRKGIAPAEGTWLDRSDYADGSEYENPPTDVQYVRIGLFFGETAAERAVLESNDGCGFSIGYYDWNRSFVETFYTDFTTLTVYYSDVESEGLVILGGDEQEFVYQSGAEAIIAIQPTGGSTYFNGNSYLGGFEFCKTHDYRMIVVNCLGLEDYVKGVVPYEMGSGWPMEALKAQAVCARTYVVYNQDQYKEYGFDLTDDARSQMYCGIDEANWWTDKAVDDTRGELIRFDGEICEIYYSAGDGGATEDGVNVFGSDRPYLCGKIDPFESAEDYYYEEWSCSYDCDAIMTRLRVNLYEIGEVVRVIPEYSDLGNVVAITYVDEDGVRLRLEGKECYTVLRLPSGRFHIRGGSGEFIFEGGGLGHNCGLSQWGAKAMDEIYGFDYQDIIRFYFTGVYIA